MRNANDIMSKDVVTVGPTSAVGEAVRLLAELRIRHLPVVDAGGQLVGIVSEHDLRERSAGDQTLIADVMTRDVMTVHGDDDLAWVAEIMASLSLTAIPVIDPGGKLAGIISYTDLLREQARLGDEPIADGRSEHIDVLEPPPDFDAPARPYPTNHGGSPIGHAVPPRRG